MNLHYCRLLRRFPVIARFERQRRRTGYSRGVLRRRRSRYSGPHRCKGNKSWSYIKDDTFKAPQFVVHQLIDTVSKNGNLLLNFGARSDGTIPEKCSRCFLPSEAG